MGNSLSATKGAADISDIISRDLQEISQPMILGNGRFLKTLGCKHAEGHIVVKMFVKKDKESLKEEEAKLVEIREKFSLHREPNLLPYRLFFETDRAAYMMRQFHYANLYDRISTRPFLSSIQKKWIAFQLLHSLRQSHSQDICHGDIKTNNVLVNTWNWVFLTDFASFKPTKLPEDNPADFSFYFDTSGRRTCYVSPERFYGKKDKDANKKERLTFAMDVFSLGCVIAELFMDGQPLFDLSQLLKYRNGEYDPKAAVVQHVKDDHVQSLILHMIQLNPAQRLSAADYLIRWDGKAFPCAFNAFLYPFQRSLLWVSPDIRILEISKRKREILEALHYLPESDASGSKSDEHGIDDIDGAVAAGPIKPSGSVDAALDGLENKTTAAAFSSSPTKGSNSPPLTALSMRAGRKPSGAPALSLARKVSFEHQYRQYAQQQLLAQKQQLQQHHQQQQRVHSLNNNKSPQQRHGQQPQQPPPQRPLPRKSKESSKVPDVLEEIQMLLQDTNEFIQSLSQPPPNAPQPSKLPTAATTGKEKHKWRPICSREATRAFVRPVATERSARADGSGSSSSSNNNNNNNSSSSSNNNNNRGEGLNLLLDVIFSCIRNVGVGSSKILALDLIVEFAQLVDEDQTLQSTIPYVITLLSDTLAIVRCEAVFALTQLLEMVSTFPLSDANIFIEYILPALSMLPYDNEEIVRAAYASNFGRLASTAKRFLEIAQLVKKNALVATADDRGKLMPSSPVSTNSPAAASSFSFGRYDAELARLQRVFNAVAQDLLVDRSSLVRCTIMEDITRLCVFFNQQNTNESILPTLITYLDNRDWQVRACFFQNIVDVAFYIYKESLEAFILPCILQALTDEQEFVLECALNSLASLTDQGLFRKHILFDVGKKTAALLCHPNLWIKHAAVGFFSAMSRYIVKIGSPIDIHAYVLPMIAPFLTTVLYDINEISLLESLKPSISRQAYNGALQAMQVLDAANDSTENIANNNNIITTTTTNNNNNSNSGSSSSSSSSGNGNGNGSDDSDDNFSFSSPVALPSIGISSNLNGNNNNADITSANSSSSGGNNSRKLTKMKTAEDDMVVKAGGGGAGEDPVILEAMLVYIRTASRMMVTRSKMWETSDDDVAESGSDSQSMNKYMALSSMVPTYPVVVPPITHQQLQQIASQHASQLQQFVSINSFLDHSSHSGSIGINSNHISGSGSNSNNNVDTQAAKEMASSLTSMTIDGPLAIMTDEGAAATAAAESSSSSATASKSSDANGQWDGVVSVIGMDGNVIPSSSSGSIGGAGDNLLDLVDGAMAGYSGSVVVAAEGGYESDGSVGGGGGGLGATHASSTSHSIANNANNGIGINTSSNPNNTGSVSESGAASTTGKMYGNAGGFVMWEGNDHAQEMIKLKMAKKIALPEPDMGPAVRSRWESDGRGGAGASAGKKGDGSASAKPGAWRPKGILCGHFHEHKSAINVVKVSPDNLFFVTASKDGTVKIWDCQRLEKSVTNRSQLTYLSQGGNITALTICENTHTIASGNMHGTIHLFRVHLGSRTDNHLYKYSGISTLMTLDNLALGGILQLAHYNTAKQSLLVFTTDNFVLAAYDLRSSQMAWKHSYPSWLGLVTAFAVGEERTWLIGGTTRGYMVCWDLRFGLIVRVWRHPSNCAVTKVVLFGKSIYDNNPMLLVSTAGSSSSSSPSPAAPAISAAVTGRAGTEAEPWQEGPTITLWDIANLTCKQLFRTLLEGESAGKPIPSLTPTIADITATPSPLEGYDDLDCANKISGVQVDHSIKCLMVGGPERNFIITAGSDCCIRYWDMLDVSNSFVVSTPDSERKFKYTSQTFEAMGGVQVNTEVSMRKPVISMRLDSTKNSKKIDAMAAVSFDRITAAELVELGPGKYTIVVCSRDGHISVFK